MNSGAERLKNRLRMPCFPLNCVSSSRPFSELSFSDPHALMGYSLLGLPSDIFFPVGTNFYPLMTQLLASLPDKEFVGL